MLRRRAFVLYRLGRFDDALSDLNLATRFDQASTAIQCGRSMNDSDMYLLAADIQLSLGQYENALASCKVAFQLKSEPSSQQESAAVDFGTTDRERAGLSWKAMRSHGTSSSGYRRARHATRA
jgi:tetratricopeptide (TPR) repeat protein